MQSGQTLAKIAKRYNIELEALCAANDLKKSDRLQPSQRLRLPSDDDREDPTPKASSSSRDGRSNAPKSKRAETDRYGSRSTSYGQYLARPARRGWVHIMGHHGEWKGQLVSKQGKLQPKAVHALSRLLAWPRTDFLMDRRLMTLLAQVSDSFGGRIVRVVSGYRTTSYSAESKHPLGRACDFHVLGVPNTALRDFVRTFDNVGVGYYPNSTFVHLDVRDHDAFWIDYAGPGEPPRSTPHRLARATEDSPLTVARATAFVKDEPLHPTEPEALEDAQPRREERHPAEGAIEPVGGSTRRAGDTNREADLARATPKAEPETGNVTAETGVLPTPQPDKAN